MMRRVPGERPPRRRTGCPPDRTMGPPPPTPRVPHHRDRPPTGRDEPPRTATGPPRTAISPRPPVIARRPTTADGMSRPPGRRRRLRLRHRHRHRRVARLSRPGIALKADITVAECEWAGRGTGSGPGIRPDSGMSPARPDSARSRPPHRGRTVRVVSDREQETDHTSAPGRRRCRRRRGGRPWTGRTVPTASHRVAAASGAAAAHCGTDDPRPARAALRRISRPAGVSPGPPWPVRRSGRGPPPRRPTPVPRCPAAPVCGRGRRRAPPWPPRPRGAPARG